MKKLQKPIYPDFISTKKIPDSPEATLVPCTRSQQHPVQNFQNPIFWTWTVEAQRQPGATESKKVTERADLLLQKVLALQAKTSPGIVPEISRSQLKRLFEEGHVFVDNHLLKGKTKLHAGMIVQIQFPPPQPTELIPENRPLEILFEDPYLLVINKPPGLTVHPSASQMTGTLVHALLHHIQDLSGIGGVLRPGIVHRIDKNTSGALVITKTDAAHIKLAETFSKHEIERCYWALCYGSLTTKNSKIESLIGRSPTDRKKMSMNVKTGRRAVTYFKKVQEFSASGKPPFASWLEVTLETGRTHQIRVHLSGLGNSILGDPTYGTPTEHQPKWKLLPQEVQAKVLSLPGQALHARTLGFRHPITGEKLRFEASPPVEFTSTLQTLQKFLAQ